MISHGTTDTSLNSKVFDYIFEANLEFCGVESISNFYYLKCDEEFILTQKIVF